MEYGTGIGYWLPGLAVYALVLVLLYNSQRVTASFRKLAPLLVWITTLVFLSWSGLLLGRYLDRVSGGHYQISGLLLGFCLGIIAASVSALWWHRRSAVLTPDPAEQPSGFHFPGIQEHDFPITVYAHYNWVMLALLVYLLGLPLLVALLVYSGYTDALGPGVGLLLLKYSILLSLVTTAAASRVAAALFRRQRLLKVTASGLSLSTGSAGDLLLSLSWTDIEGIRFKLKHQDGVLQVYSGKNTLLRLYCVRQKARPDHAGLRQLTDFLTSSFDRKYIEKKTGFRHSLITGVMTEIRNRYYSPEPAATTGQPLHLPA